MSEQETVVSEEVKEESTEVKESEEPTAESTTEEILDFASKQEEAEHSEESTTSKDEQTDKTAEVVKTDKVDVDTTEKPVDEVKEGDPIPYARFKEVNDKLKPLESELEQAKKRVADSEEIFKDPEILSLVLKKRGYSDEAIAQYLQKSGMETLKPKSEHDFNTVDGWKEYVQEQIKLGLQPVQQSIAKQTDTMEAGTRAKQQDKEFAEVGVLAKDSFGLEMGEIGKSEKDVNTAVGIMSQYLDKHPEHEGRGFAETFKLAMFGRGMKEAEKRGEDKEKDRQTKVKAAASESDSTITVDEQPSADWSTEKIIKWREEHNK